MSVGVRMGRNSLEVTFSDGQVVIDKVKRINGYELDKKKGCWKFPVDIEAFVGLTKEFGTDLSIDRKVRTWVTGELERRATIASVRENSGPVELLYEYEHRLMEYQRRMVLFMVAARRLMCSDQMGLGKTVETIAALREMELQSERHPEWPDHLKIDGMPRYLIICPNSMRHTWAREIRTWHPREDMPIHFVDTGKEGLGHRGWFIVNWEKAWRRIDYLLHTGWTTIIGDESHRMKNPSAKQTKGMFRLENSWNRILLTGTPIRNHVPDLWAQLYWLDKKRFPSYWKFVDRFTITQEAHGAGGRTYKEIVGTKNEEDLRKVLETIQWGRRIDDPGIGEEIDLPELIGPRIVPVKLGDRQRVAYNQMRDEFVAILQSEAPGGSDVVVRSPSFMTHALRLKQLAGSLGIFSEEHKESAKIDAVYQRISETEIEKHVVMSQFRTMALEFHQRMKDEGLSHILMTGLGVGQWTPGGGYEAFKDRDEAVLAFNTQPQWRAFIATIQTGGEGVTLVGGRYFHFLDLMWTPAENDQAWQRVYRKGQTRTTFVFSYLALDTIDFSGVLPTLMTKQAIVDAVFGRSTEVPLTTDGSVGQSSLDI